MQEILAARENRVAKQQELLTCFGKPLICFTMNIAGPKKYSNDIFWGFRLGNQWLKAQLADLSVLHYEELLLPTGCESYFVVDSPAELLKERTIQIEDSAPVARLFDMDVLDCDGHKLDRRNFGYPQRKCLLCDQPAHICGRSRTHSVEALQAKTAALLREAIIREDSKKIAQTAQQSLLYEACTTPKPGLVDCRNNGSHQDMDIFSFMVSTASLSAYFTRCAQIGAETKDLSAKDVFARLRLPGRLAEHTMYQATNGVNTHKGSIFSLGILCAAAGRLGPHNRTSEAILTVCKAMTQGIVDAAFRNVTENNTATTGEALYVKFGITGVRGQAEQGYPQVLQVGLPVLKKGLQAGLSLNDAGCAVLLALLSTAVDTNLIHRSSLQEQQALAAEIGELLQQNPYPSQAELEKLDDRFIARNLSPGGCADLLAITYFLHFLTQQDLSEEIL